MLHDAIKSILLDHNPWWQDPGARRATGFPVRRDLHARVLEHLASAGRRAAVVMGPRQVGKTVLLLQTADELLDGGLPPANLTYFDFSDDRIPGKVTPRDVVEFVHPSVSPGPPRIFLLDEISKSAKWGPWLKQAVDARQDRYVVTDSAASLLRGEGRESGQGRWDELRMEGLSFREFLRLLPEASGEAPEKIFRRVPNAVELYLALGGFPEHARSREFAQVRERLRADIADRAIRRDLLGLGVDVERVKDLFVYLVQDSGAIFNARKRGRDLNADERSIAQWVQLLEDAHLLARLRRHAGSATARLRSQPRVYATDHGLVAAFTPSPPPLSDVTIRGRVVETVVFRHLREVAGSLHGELSFFRRDDDLEAGFVFELRDTRIIIEATASAAPQTRRYDRLLRIGEILKTPRLVLLHGGVLEGKTGPVRPVSLGRFLLDPMSIVQEKP